MVSDGGIGLSLLVSTLIVAQIAGCASVHEERPNVLIADSHYFRTNATIPVEHKFTVVDQDRAQAPGMLRLPVGLHTIQVSVIWSNGYKEAADVAFEVIANERYVFYAVERGVTQDPSSIIIRPKTAQEQLGDDAVESFLWGFAPFWFPFSVTDALRRQRLSAAGRPFETCCFVWVAEVQTGRIVAGQPPSGSK